MLRVLIRFLGLMLLATGFAALVVDGARSIASDTLVLTSLGQTLAGVAPAKYPLLQSAVENRFGHWAWDPLLTTLLALPTWLVACVLGALLFALARRRRVTVGYASR